MPVIESDRWLISKTGEIIFAASGERRTPGRYVMLPDLIQLTCPGWSKSRRLPRIGRESLEYESLLYDRVESPVVGIHPDSRNSDDPWLTTEVPHE